MPCDGYEHGSRVAAREDLPEWRILAGTVGVVVGINRESHELDIEFPKLGKISGLPAYKFKTAPPPEKMAQR